MIRKLQTEWPDGDGDGDIWKDRGLTSYACGQKKVGHRDQAVSAFYLLYRKYNQIHFDLL